MLDYDGNECAGQPIGTCHSEASNSITVDDAGPDSITLKCPADFPYLIGWDTEQSEFLRVLVTSHDPSDEPRVRRLTVSVLNDAVADGADAAGTVQLYIGCSRNSWKGTPFGSERGGLPSNGILEGASQEESQ
jgi:hypothetical protein